MPPPKKNKSQPKKTSASGVKALPKAQKKALSRPFKAIAKVKVSSRKAVSKSPKKVEKKASKKKTPLLKKTGVSGSSPQKFKKTEAIPRKTVAVPMKKPLPPPIPPQKNGPAKKFKAAQPSASSSAFQEPSFSYPRHYGYDQVTLLVRDPHCVFAYWSLTDDTVHNLKARFAEETDFDKIKLSLRIFDGKDGFSSEAKPLQEIFPAYGSVNYYLPVAASGQYFCDIGFLTVEGDFLHVARSNLVETPSDHFSQKGDESWITWENFHRVFDKTILDKAESETPSIRKNVKQELKKAMSSKALSSGALSSASVSSGALSSGAMSSESLSSGSLSSGALSSGVLSSGVLVKVALPSGALSSGALSSGALSSGALSSGSLSSAALSSTAWSKIPLSQLSSGSLSSHALSSGALSSGSLSSASLSSGSLSSGALSSHSLSSGSLSSHALSSGALSSSSVPAVKKDVAFPFVVNTEMVLYGRTDPLATLYVQGLAKKVNPDGTFSVRFSIPEGQHAISIKAVLPSGEEVAFEPLVSKEMRPAPGKEKSKA